MLALCFVIICNVYIQKSFSQVYNVLRTGWVLLPAFYYVVQVELKTSRTLTRPESVTEFLPEL